jgi:hypothetical protein
MFKLIFIDLVKGLSTMWKDAYLIGKLMNINDEEWWWGIIIVYENILDESKFKTKDKILKCFMIYFDWYSNYKIINIFLFFFKIVGQNEFYVIAFSLTINIEK